MATRSPSLLSSSSFITTVGNLKCLTLYLRLAWFTCRRLVWFSIGMTRSFQRLYLSVLLLELDVLCSLTNFCQNFRSWLERIHALAGGVRLNQPAQKKCLEATFSCLDSTNLNRGGPLRPEVQRQLASLSSVAAQTLQLAASYLGSGERCTNNLDEFFSS